MGVRIYRRKDKPHLGWWVYLDIDGKRTTKLIGDKTAALEVARKIEAKIALGEFRIDDATEDDARPLSRYFQDWLKTHARINCKPSTLRGYEIAWRRWIEPALGQRDIRRLTKEEVRALATKMIEAGRSRAYVKGTLAPLSAVLNRAIEDGVIARNPTLHALPRSRQDKRQTSDFLTLAELGHLLETCRKHFPAHYPFILLLSRAGLRVGEAVALQWGDVDFHGLFLNVIHNWVDGHFYMPKSGEGRRVDLSPHLAETLKALLMERKKEVLRKGWAEVPPWVLLNEVGKIMGVDNFRHRLWQRILVRAGLRRIRLQDLRHTFASLLIQQGSSLAYIKEQLGHHSIKVTVDTYGHLVPGANRREIEQLDSLLFPGVPQA